MRWADNVYDHWAAQQPDYSLPESDVPLTAIAEVDDEAALEEHGPQPTHPTHTAWDTVHWQPRLGEILEDSEESLGSTSDGTTGRPSVEKQDPGRKKSDAEISVREALDFQRTRTGSGPHDASPNVTRKFSSAQFPPGGPMSRRTSIAGGTTHWAPQSIHYRIRTRSGMGSISGASMFSTDIEVESLSDKKKVCVFPYTHICLR